MPIELQDLIPNGDTPSATIYVNHRKHGIVVDTSLKDFEKDIAEIGILEMIAASVNPDRMRYFIKVHKSVSMEKAAETIGQKLAEIAHEVVDMGAQWDIWKE